MYVFNKCWLRAYSTIYCIELVKGFCSIGWPDIRKNWKATHFQSPRINTELIAYTYVGTMRINYEHAHNTGTLIWITRSGAEIGIAYYIKSLGKSLVATLLIPRRWNNFSLLLMPLLGATTTSWPGKSVPCSIPALSKKVKTRRFFSHQETTVAGPIDTVK